MAQVTLRLVYDPDTGKKDIFIDFASDEDALPVEHERAHRELVARLLGQGVLRPDEVGRVVVTREGAAAPASSQPTLAPGEREGLTEPGG